MVRTLKLFIHRCLKSDEIFFHNSLRWLFITSCIRVDKTQQKHQHYSYSHNNSISLRCGFGGFQARNSSALSFSVVNLSIIRSLKKVVMEISLFTTMCWAWAALHETLIDAFRSAFTMCLPCCDFSQCDCYLFHVYRMSTKHHTKLSE